MTQKLIKRGSSDAKQLEFLWWQKCLTDTLNLEIVQRKKLSFFFLSYSTPKVLVKF